jgi:hypothetical protein
VTYLAVIVHFMRNKVRVESAQMYHICVKVCIEMA